MPSRREPRSSPGETVRVVLASMPWSIFNRPSIQLGALQSYIRAHEPSIDVVALHPYLTAAQKIGLDAYRIISGDSWAGEALYCSLLFPERTEGASHVFHTSLGRKTASSLPAFAQLRAKLDSHLDEWLAAHDFSTARLAGFSVCFGQLPATLLAVKRLKRQYPRLPIVLGGSTCAPQVGNSLLQLFPDLDYIITGEGEQPLLDLCRFLQGRAEGPGAEILVRRHGEDAINRGISPAAANEVQDLNSLPLPDYADYFAELKQTGLGFIPQLPIEFSRGCWWNKCAFCNLNLQWCGYRFKKSERMGAEVEQLQKRYRCLDFSFTDNALPPAEADRFFPAMEARGTDTRFFAEIRTINKPERYRRYRRGGLNAVQIGIEAFSDSLLKRMNKGVMVMDNLAAMKHCTEAGIVLDGNLILEFPGSTAEEVRETLRVLDFALPFRPLSGAAFFLGHGSPVWNAPGKYGLRSIRHHPYNRKLYPAPVLQRLELLIKQGTGDRREQRKLWRPVRNKIREWSLFHSRRAADRPALSLRQGDDFIIIRQERPGQQTRHHRLSGMSARIYLACGSPVATRSLFQSFNSVTEQALTIFLDDLENKRLVFREKNMVLALAVRHI